MARGGEGTPCCPPAAWHGAKSCWDPTRGWNKSCRLGTHLFPALLQAQAKDEAFPEEVPRCPGLSQGVPPASPPGSGSVLSAVMGCLLPSDMSHLLW